MNKSWNFLIRNLFTCLAHKLWQKKGNGEDLEWSRRFEGIWKDAGHFGQIAIVV